MRDQWCVPSAVAKEAVVSRSLTDCVVTVITWLQKDACLALSFRSEARLLSLSPLAMGARSRHCPRG